MHRRYQRLASLLEGAVRQGRVRPGIRPEVVERRRHPQPRAQQIGELQIDGDSPCVQASSRGVRHRPRVRMRFPESPWAAGGPIHGTRTLQP